MVSGLVLSLHRAHVVLGVCHYLFLVCPSVRTRGETGMCVISHVVEGPTGVQFPAGTAVMSSYLGRLGDFELPEDEQEGRSVVEDLARHVYIPVVRADGPNQPWEVEDEFTVRILL